MFCSCRISTDKCLVQSLCNSRASCDTIPECDRQTHTHTHTTAYTTLSLALRGKNWGTRTKIWGSKMADSYHQTLKIWNIPGKAKIWDSTSKEEVLRNACNAKSLSSLCIAMHGQVTATSNSSQISISGRINFLFPDVTWTYPWLSITKFWGRFFQRNIHSFIRGSGWPLAVFRRAFQLTDSAEA